MPSHQRMSKSDAARNLTISHLTRVLSVGRKGLDSLAPPGSSPTVLSRPFVDSQPRSSGCLGMFEIWGLVRGDRQVRQMSKDRGRLIRLRS